MRAFAQEIQRALVKSFVADMQLWQANAGRKQGTNMADVDNSGLIGAM
jgi:hypothetical protein